MPRSDLWTDDELRFALAAYLEALAWEQAGSTFQPTALHQQLATGLLKTRTQGSVSRRMSNISAVMLKAGEPVVSRYRPDFDHVGSGVTTTILRLLGELRASALKPTADRSLLESRSNTVLAHGPNQRPKGTKRPKKTTTQVSTFVRSVQVVAWVLHEANGYCDGCGLIAPFSTAAGRPFLEVHHVLPLADGGPDVVENAVALCPNCHRRLHHSSDRHSYKSFILNKHIRLREY